MSYTVRYSYDESPCGTSHADFDTFEEALDFADFVRGEINPLVGGWVEFDEIAAFAQAIEQAAGPRLSGKQRLVDLGVERLGFTELGK